MASAITEGKKGGGGRYRWLPEARAGRKYSRKGKKRGESGHGFLAQSRGGRGEDRPRIQ